MILHTLENPAIVTEFPESITDTTGFQEDIFIGADVEWDDPETKGVMTSVRYRLESETPARWDQSGTYHLSKVPESGAASSVSLALSLSMGQTEGPWSSWITVTDDLDNSTFIGGPLVGGIQFTRWGPQPFMGDWDARGGMARKAGYHAFLSSDPVINKVYASAVFSGSRQACPVDEIEALSYEGSLATDYDEDGAAVEDDDEEPEDLVRVWTLDVPNQLARPPLGPPFTRGGLIVSGAPMTTLFAPGEFEENGRGHWGSLAAGYGDERDYKIRAAVPVTNRTATLLNRETTFDCDGSPRTHSLNVSLGAEVTLEYLQSLVAAAIEENRQTQAFDTQGKGIDTETGRLNNDGIALSHVWSAWTPDHEMFTVDQRVRFVVKDTLFGPEISLMIANRYKGYPLERVSYPPPDQISVIDYTGLSLAYELVSLNLATGEYTIEEESESESIDAWFSGTPGYAHWPQNLRATWSGPAYLNQGVLTADGYDWTGGNNER